MATILKDCKQVERELTLEVMDAGSRPLVVTLRGDGFIELRPKGLRRAVVWKADALYVRGVQEGRVR